jgi:hypothetical protein
MYEAQQPAAPRAAASARRCSYLRSKTGCGAWHGNCLSEGIMHNQKIVGRTLQLPAVLVCGVLVSCASTHKGGPTAAAPPMATLQELMSDVVDPSADGFWDAVETTVGVDGENTRRPRNDAEWAQVRRSLIVLRDASLLLQVHDRALARQAFKAEAQGALDSAQISTRMLRERAAFDAFAAALGQTAHRALDAVEARDVAAMVRIGGELDAVCEACHLHFWYPQQVIPPLP